MQFVFLKNHPDSCMTNKMKETIVGPSGKP